MSYSEMMSGWNICLSLTIHKKGPKRKGASTLSMLWYHTVSFIVPRISTDPHASKDRGKLANKSKKNTETRIRTEIHPLSQHEIQDWVNFNKGWMEVNNCLIPHPGLRGELLTSVGDERTCVAGKSHKNCQTKSGWRTGLDRRAVYLCHQWRSASVLTSPHWQHTLSTPCTL